MCIRNSPPPSSPFLWVTSMQRFRGRGGKSQINKISFQSLCSQRERVGWGLWGGLWPATANCWPYPERSVYTTRKVKQIGPRRRFEPPCCHLQSLCSSSDLPLCLCCLCFCIFICVLSHMCARPGSREAFGETSGWHGALLEAGNRMEAALLPAVFTWCSKLLMTPVRKRDVMFLVILHSEIYCKKTLQCSCLHVYTFTFAFGFIIVWSWQRL